MRTCRAHVFVVSVLTLWSGACGSAGPVAADRFDVDLRVLSNGNVEVREELTVRFSPPASTEFERQVDLNQADELRFVSASVDGQLVERDRSRDPRVVVTDGRRLHVQWRLQGPGAGRRVFGLRYVAVGAVAVRGGRGVLRLMVVPDRRRYPIDAGYITLRVPDAAQVFGGSGIAEAGWAVARTPDGITAERRGIDPNAGATVVSEFSVDRSTIAEPAWQFNQEWSQELAPAFISGGLFILVVGAGVLWIVRFQYPPSPREGGTRARSRGFGGTSPPSQHRNDSERGAVRAGLHRAGLVAVAVALVSALAGWMSLAHLGLWPMALPASILTVGVVFVAVSHRIV